MSPDEKQPVPGSFDELESLLSAACDGRLTDDQAGNLDLLLRSDPAARQAYLQYMHLHSQLGRLLRVRHTESAFDDSQWIQQLFVAPDEPAAEVQAIPASPGLDDAMIIPALLDEPEAEYAPSPSPLVYPIHRWQRADRWPVTFRHLLRRGWPIAAGVMLVLGIGMAWRWAGSSPPVAVVPPQPSASPEVEISPPVLATVAGEFDARWSGTAQAPALGERLPAGPLVLNSGLIRIAFVNGASAILEGPATFEIESGSQVLLTGGRLSAKVPGPAAGFTVRTPQAVVTDLGTEFGVKVVPDGTADVEVFVGRVDAAPAASPDRASNVQARVLTQGQAALVSSAAVTLDPAGALPQRFVRSLETVSGSLDVVDLFCGGDGTTHRRGMSVDATTGRSGLLPASNDEQSDGKYHHVPALTVLDGCFIPDGRKGAVTVDSAGHTFAFPATTGTSFNRIWAGGTIPVTPGTGATSTILGGVDYATPGHGSLFMSANKGLTFDLAAIGRLNPGADLTRFRCQVGNGFPLDVARPKADVYVLVDGQPRFERRGFTNADGSLPVDVPLKRSDRFITLAVTDGGDGISADGVLWADPLLDVTAPAAGQGPRKAQLSSSLDDQLKK